MKKRFLSVTGQLLAALFLFSCIKEQEQVSCAILLLEPITLANLLLLLLLINTPLIYYVLLCQN